MLGENPETCGGLFLWRAPLGDRPGRMGGSFICASLVRLRDLAKIGATAFAACSLPLSPSFRVFLPGSDPLSLSFSSFVHLCSPRACVRVGRAGCGVCAGVRTRVRACLREGVGGCVRACVRLL